MLWIILSLCYAMLRCLVPCANRCDSYSISHIYATSLISADPRRNQRIITNSRTVIQLGLQLSNPQSAYQSRDSIIPTNAVSRNNDESDSPWISSVPEQMESTDEDMQRLAFLLANVTDHLDSSPAIALTILSQEMGWLYSKNVPKLTEQLLSEFPILRRDNGMMRAYTFMLDFLEVVSKETSKRLKENQTLLRHLLEAAKVSEEKLNEHIAVNRAQLTGADFRLYLDTEIEAQDTNSPQENMLVTVKLRLLDELGKSMGVDVMILPQLAAEEDPAELTRKTILHLEGYDTTGQQLFLQTLRIMLGEMKKRYQAVDPLLLLNLREVERIAEGFVNRKTNITGGSSS